MQFYKFLRLGRMGYTVLCENMMKNAKAIRDGLKEMTYNGNPRFLILDDGDHHVRLAPQPRPPSHASYPEPSSRACACRISLKARPA